MPEMSLWLWGVTFFSGLIASVATTLTGIGGGLITYGVLNFFMPLKIIIPLAAPAQFFSGGLRLWLFRRHVQWRLGGLFLLGVLPGIYLGAWVFSILSEVALRRILGAVLLVFAAYEGLKPSTKHHPPHPAWLPFGGVCAGVLLGSMGVPGPLLAVIFLRYGLLKEDLIAMIALFFLVGNAQRTWLYWQQGALGGETLLPAIVLGIAMIAGVYAGRMLLPLVSQALFLKLVLGMLLVFGGKFLFW